MMVFDCHIYSEFQQNGRIKLVIHREEFFSFLTICHISHLFSSFYLSLFLNRKKNRKKKLKFIRVVIKSDKNLYNAIFLIEDKKKGISKMCYLFFFLIVLLEYYNSNFFFQILKRAENFFCSYKIKRTFLFYFSNCRVYDIIVSIIIFITDNVNHTILFIKTKFVISELVQFSLRFFLYTFYNFLKLCNHFYSQLHLCWRN